jgi:osmotically-inducible protein OsmY
MKRKILAVAVLGATLLPALQGCFPVVAAGVTTGVMATVDRRSVGTQTEDESIEWKASSRVSEKIKDKTHLNFTSFNRKVLVTGEVPTAEAKAEIDRVVAAVPNVLGVHNEVAVAPLSSYTDRSNDSFITSKVKTRSVDTGKFNPIQLKVVTEASVTYLMGLMTQAEADAAINVARTTAGVKKVVNLIEIITPEKARELDIASSSDKTK